MARCLPHSALNDPPPIKHTIRGGSTSPRPPTAFTLSAGKSHIQSYVFDVIRATVPKLAFEQKNEIAKAVEAELEMTLKLFLAVQSTGSDEFSLTTSEGGSAIRPQINSFSEGFSALIPRELISMFNDKEPELLISGLREINLNDLQANAKYSGYTTASNAVTHCKVYQAQRGFRFTKLMDLQKGYHRLIPVIGDIVARRRKDFTKDFFMHLHAVAESYHDNEVEQNGETQIFVIPLKPLMLLLDVLLSIAIIGNICLAYVQAYDTASESIEAINVAELKFNNIISSLYVLAGKSQLDSALVLMITKVWSTAKETNMMKDEVKDILYHFYMTARGLSSSMNVHISNLDIMRPFAESVLKSIQTPLLQQKWLFNVQVRPVAQDEMCRVVRTGKRKRNGNMEPVPTDGLEPNGGNVGKLGVWSVGIRKLLSPVLGSPGMFKRRRASRLLE
ncbi:uncharacterized protein Tco_0162563 [Tanacetum coccineum]